MGQQIIKLVDPIITFTDGLIDIKPDEVDNYVWLVCTAIIKSGSDERKVVDICETKSSVTHLNGLYITYEECDFSNLIAEIINKMDKESNPDKDQTYMTIKNYKKYVDKLIGRSVRDIFSVEAKSYTDFDEWLTDNKFLFNTDKPINTFKNAIMRKDFIQPVGIIEDNYKINLKCALSLETIIVKHLCGCHLSRTQGLLIKLVTSNILNQLGDKERCFINHLFVGTNSINHNVPILADGSGTLVHLASGIEEKSYMDLLSTTIKSQKELTNSQFVNEVVKSNHNGWNSVVDQVMVIGDELIKKHFNFKPLSQEIYNELLLCNFLATFYHDIVGDTQTKAIYESILPMRLQRNKTNETTKTYAFISVAAAVGVSIRGVKLREVTDERVRPFYQEYCLNLSKIQGIDEYVDINLLETSVGF